MEIENVLVERQKSVLVAIESVLVNERQENALVNVLRETENANENDAATLYSHNKSILNQGNTRVCAAYSNKTYERRRSGDRSAGERER